MKSLALSQLAICLLIGLVACSSGTPCKAESIADFFRRMVSKSNRELETKAAKITGSTERLEKQTGALLRPKQASQAVLGDHLRLSLNAREISEFERDLAQFAGPLGLDFKTQSMEKLQRAAELIHADPGVRAVTVPYDKALPHLRIRATGVADYDEALLKFSHYRFRSALEERFDIADLRVIPLAMSENAQESAREVARYARWLPWAQQDVVGPLAQLARGELPDLSHQAKVALLRPYARETIVLVGHIPAGSDTFIAITAQGAKAVKISDWMAAAAEAHVNLMPIGCNSGKFASFGTSGLVNSQDVLTRLLNIMTAKPTSVQEFLKTLTGEDLTLLVNVFDARLFANSHAIVTRQVGEKVGQLTWNIALRGSRRNTGSPPRVPNYGRCFQQATAQGFQSCAAEETGSFEAQRAAARISVAQELRASGLVEAGHELAARREHYDDARFATVVLSISCVVSWLLACFSTGFGHAIRKLEREAGRVRLRFLVSANAIRSGLRLMLPIPGQETFRSESYFDRTMPISLGIAVDLGALSCFAGLVGSPWPLALAWVAGLAVGKRTLRFVWDAVVRRSLGSGLIAAASVAWLLLGFFTIRSGFMLDNSRSELQRAQARLGELESDAPTASWRNVVLAEYDE